VAQICVHFVVVVGLSGMRMTFESRFYFWISDKTEWKKSLGRNRQNILSYINFVKWFKPTPTSAPMGKFLSALPSYKGLAYLATANFLVSLLYPVYNGFLIKFVFQSRIFFLLLKFINSFFSYEMVKAFIFMGARYEFSLIRCSSTAPIWTRTFCSFSKQFLWSLSPSLPFLYFMESKRNPSTWSCTPRSCFFS
jgi:hypothetical protein